MVTAYLLAQTVVTPIYGKLGDLYGRKVVLQAAIALFLLGSMLCGLSASMGQLVFFRALQGLGGGGLIVTSQAVVGDIVSPRERGRYQGIFGAVFGLSSIAGPFAGGYFTTHLSWRWIFYINLPFGLLALLVIAATLPRRAGHVRRSIDYAGAALLAVTLSGIILITDLGGTTFVWNSPAIYALAATTGLALLAFVYVERRAAEPVLPLRLFANRTFAVASVVGLIVGFAHFGSVTYIPLFLQVVNGASPTGSRLLLLPMIAGNLLTSITAGQVISRRGRYRVYPIVGTAVIAVGLFLLSRMTARTTVPEASVNMLVLGLGMGLVMQVLVIAVQNAVDYRDLGVATSGATLFRLIGGSLGAAIFGAIIASRLTAYLTRALPGGAAAAGEGEYPPHHHPGMRYARCPAGPRRGGEGGGLSRQMLEHLPPAVRAIYVNGFTVSLSTVFLTAALVALAGLLLAWFLPEQPLRETVAAAAGDLGAETEAVFPLPTDTESISKLERFLSLLADRDVRRGYIQAVVSRAGLDVSPLAAWLLVRLDADPELDLDALAGLRRIDPDRLEGALAELRGKRLIREEPAGPTGPRAVSRPAAAARRFAGSPPRAGGVSLRCSPNGSPNGGRSSPLGSAGCRGRWCPTIGRDGHSESTVAWAPAGPMPAPAPCARPAGEVHRRSTAATASRIGVVGRPISRLRSRLPVNSSPRLTPRSESASRRA